MEIISFIEKIKKISTELYCWYYGTWVPNYMYEKNYLQKSQI